MQSFILITLLITIVVVACIPYNIHEFYTHSVPKADLVIAKYNESLGWLKELDASHYRTIFIYNKGTSPPSIEIPSNAKIIALPNVGRCDHTYLHHIISNYNNLADVTVFLPGSCDMAHKWEFAQKTIHSALQTNTSCFVVHNITEDDVKTFTLNEWKASAPENQALNPETNLYPCPERPFGKWYETNFPGIHFRGVVYYGIFAASRVHIQQRNLSSYTRLIKYLDVHSNPEAGHYFERSWLAVFHPIPHVNKIFV